MRNETSNHSTEMIMRTFTSGLSHHMARRHSDVWSYFLTPTPLRAQEIPQEEGAKKKRKPTVMHVNILGYNEELWESGHHMNCLCFFCRKIIILLLP